VTFTNNTFSENTATGFGAGACALSYYGTVTFTNNIFSENTAGSGGGGGLYIEFNDDPAIGNIFNNVAWNNTSTGKGDDIYVNDDNEGNSIGATVNLYNNDFGPDSNDLAIEVGDNLSQGGNINTDPLFVDPATGDFHLQAGSPCIDAGTNDAPGLFDTDFEGDPRVFDGDNDGTATVDMGADEYVVEKLMVVRQRTDGKYKLQIYDVPTTVGGNTGPAIASDNNIGKNVLDIAGGDWDGYAGDELVVMRGTPGKARKLFIYSMPDEVGGNTGPAIASDRWFGKYRDYMTVGNFDGDPEPEVTVVQYVSAKDIYRLFIYDMPTTVDGDTGPAIASDRNIGGNVIGIAAANFDADPEDELVIVRLRPDGKHKLQIYDVPTTVGGNTGSPIVSDNNIYKNIITCGVAAGNFDDDPEPEVAVVRLLASGNHKLVIYDAPTSVGGDTGLPIATDNNIGKNITAIAACIAAW